MLNTFCLLHQVKDPKITNHLTLLLNTILKASLAKFQFFKGIASILQNYLLEFQTDSPVIPFICDEFSQVIRNMRIFVKRECLLAAKTTYKLITLDVSKKDNLVAPEKIKLPTATNDLVMKTVLCPKEKAVAFKVSCVQNLNQHHFKTPGTLPFLFLLLGIIRVYLLIAWWENKKVSY